MNTATAPQDSGHRAELAGAIFWIALCFSAYQLWMSSFHPLSSQVIRAIHVGFVLLMVFVLYPPFYGRQGFLDRKSVV